MFALSITATLLSLLASANAQNSDGSGRKYVYPNCAIVSFNCEATASNYDFPLNVSDHSQLNQTIQTHNYTIGKPFTLTSKIVARYCEPENYVPEQSDKLEFLLHSITNNKNFWSGLGEPGKGFQGDSYSWIAYASKAGYATLSLDRLGNGESDHPDPLFVVQGPYEFALYHKMIEQIKSGAGSPLPKTYGDIILIGNSYGSVIVDNMAALYPEDSKTVIMTGYSHDALSSFPGIIAVLPLPAALAIPTRFATLPLGYVTTTLEGSRRGAFYGSSDAVDFPFDISVLDNNVRDVVSLGQFLSNYILGSVVADKYTGRALVLTGERDNAFCGPGNLLLGDLAKCGQRLPDTGKLFPVASDYSWYSVARTGHSNPFHTSRNETFKVAHDFIGGAKFQKTG